MRLDKALTLIKSFEGLMDGNPETVNLDPYLCPAGFWTIGWGHLIRDLSGASLAGNAAKKIAYDLYPGGISMYQAEQLLIEDVQKVVFMIEPMIKPMLSENQFNALVSFTFNVGVGNFKNSTLRQKINLQDYTGASEEFLKWVKAGRRTLPGLVKRRQAERDLWNQQ